ncbi:MAG: hypothetical protein HFE39_05025 [Clostridiales bacterium]|nr:hypothetical protein [Clostridiales bacterium]
MKPKEAGKEIRRYLKPVKKLLKCYRTSQKRFYRDLTVSAEEFLNTNPQAGREDLHKFLGDPECLVLNFMEQIDEKEIVNARRRSMVFLVVCLSIAALILVMIVSFFFQYIPVKMTIIENSEVITRYM